jgi:two-component system C4-dicarboxylate transport sensor histidine kinase DctB
LSLKNTVDSMRLTVKKSFKLAAFRISLSLLICLLAGWSVSSILLERNHKELRERTKQRLDYYRLSLETTIDRNESLPFLISLDGRLRTLLEHPGAGERQAADDFLKKVKERADIAAAYLMNTTGLTVASSNAGQAGSFIGNNYSFRPYFKEAIQGKLGRYYGIGSTTGEPGYFLAAPIKSDHGTVGAVTVKVSLAPQEAALQKSGDIVLLADSWGVIFLSTIDQWKYRTISDLKQETLRQLRASRQYGDQNLLSLKDALKWENEASLAEVTLPGQKSQPFLVLTQTMDHLGWKFYLLSETRQERKSALTGGIAAGFATGFIILIFTYFRLNAERYQERRQAKAAMRQAHQELEQRITERTCDLISTNQSLENKVHELKTAEDILRETSDNAVQAGKLAVLGQMSAGISQEINQPLTALITFADNAVSFLDRGRLESVRDNLGLIRQMADRMGHIVNEVKNFSRKTPAERRKILLADVLNQTLMLVETERRRVDATIEILPYTNDLVILAGPIRIGQVLVNLLRNALDAVAGLPERRITVTVQHNGDEVAIFIKDSGPGIPPEVLPRLFEPFFTTKPPGQGLGLGLPISRVIITELGGSLEARNHESGGAEFIVTMEAA